MSNSRNKNCNSIHHSLNLSIFIPTTNHRLIVTRHAGKCFQDFFLVGSIILSKFILFKNKINLQWILWKNCLLIYFSNIKYRNNKAGVRVCVCLSLHFEWNFLAIKNLEKKFLKFYWAAWWFVSIWWRFLKVLKNVQYNISPNYHISKKRHAVLWDE